ncbi:MAG: protoporphyrinogen oxidase HemJ [bacterium]|nr:protoporphyrinogen oxidase HemJ [bacterium]
MVSWMAGMLCLPRLFSYHAKATAHSEASETFKVMERRLLRIIINPAMIATFLFGGALVLIPGVVDWSQGWMHAKLTLVLLLSGIHGMLARYRKVFEQDANKKSPRYFRILNEVPALILIIVVFLVVLKPF